MKILFAGTPEIAVPTLRAVAEHFDVQAVLTNTDKQGARGRHLIPSPIKVAAEELGIEVLQYDRLRGDAREAVAATGCDTLLCFAYGRIFGPKFLSLFSKEKLNIHPSLLPLLRGPSPIQGAIEQMFSESGISVQRLAQEMDSGAILVQESFALGGDETTATLSERVALAAAPLAVRALEAIADGSAHFVEQSGEPTYTTLITAEMAELDFSRSAQELHAQIRAMAPWPKARARYDGQLLYINEVYGTLAEAGTDAVPSEAKPGMVVARDRKRGVAIATGSGLLWVTGLQLEKRKALDALSFLNGNQSFLGAELTSV